MSLDVVMNCGAGNALRGFEISIVLYKYKVFLQTRILYSWTQNSPIWTRKFSSSYLHLHQIDIWNGFLRYDQICVEKLPLVKIRKNKPKSEISLSQLQNIRNIKKNYFYIYVFVDDKCNAII